MPHQRYRATCNGEDSDYTGDSGDSGGNTTTAEDLEDIATIINNIIVGVSNTEFLPYPAIVVPPVAIACRPVSNLTLQFLAFARTVGACADSLSRGARAS